MTNVKWDLHAKHTFYSTKYKTSKTAANKDKPKEPCRLCAAHCVDER